MTILENTGKVKFFIREKGNQNPMGHFGLFLLWKIYNNENKGKSMS